MKHQNVRPNLFPHILQRLRAPEHLDAVVSRALAPPAPSLPWHLVPLLTSLPPLLLLRGCAQLLWLLLLPRDARDGPRLQAAAAQRRDARASPVHDRSKPGLVRRLEPWRAGEQHLMEISDEAHQNVRRPMPHILHPHPSPGAVKRQTPQSHGDRPTERLTLTYVLQSCTSDFGFGQRPVASCQRTNPITVTHNTISLQHALFCVRADNQQHTARHHHTHTCCSHFKKSASMLQTGPLRPALLPKLLPRCPLLKLITLWL